MFSCQFEAKQKLRTFYSHIQTKEDTFWKILSYNSVPSHRSKREINQIRVLESYI